MASGCSAAMVLVPYTEEEPTPEDAHPNLRVHPQLTQPKKATSVEQAEAVSALLAARAEGKPPIEVLGLHPSANKAEARRRFRYLSLLVHPDKNASAGAADAFKVLADAYKAL